MLHQDENLGQVAGHLGGHQIPHEFQNLAIGKHGQIEEQG
jgi:hypothetical protein